MVEQIKWIERKFDFNLPAGVFPNLLERMSGTIPRLEEITKNVSEEILSAKFMGSWSIKEHIGHLIIVESLHETRLNEIIEGKEHLTAADMTNRKTNEAPHNSQSISELLKNFRHTREEFIKRLEILDEEQVLRSGHHPRLNKPMRIVDIAYFTSEHDDHHIAAIRNILRNK